MKRGLRRSDIQVQGQERVFTPDDGGVRIEPWTHHRILSTPPPNDPSGKRSVFILSSTVSQHIFKLDEVFYENWHSYQKGFIVHGGSLSLLQVLIKFSMLDLRLTSCVLRFSMPVDRIFHCQVGFHSGNKFPTTSKGIGMGRYLAAALGYQSYYRQWTTK
ncbi:hypothetical protein N8I77_000148 [Diaporthe amygdali]|uniref:Uncharacterized protein n=1 Tax=Phomopsis amygdali TaxID=1214568 RepID=A0AAD9SLM9_PHOAM|nr:hypothetical protein N8I77_000148 [Diaporthe amygdali]